MIHRPQQEVDLTYKLTFAVRQEVASIGLTDKSHSRHGVDSWETFDQPSPGRLNAGASPPAPAHVGAARRVVPRRSVCADTCC